ncbi:hypothetical protein FACS189479_01270 [Spirochaetia bacterium]|nr:hypothetical protein FACS189479_01270 [Spirochaetia bacterium]
MERIISIDGVKARKWLWPVSIFGAVICLLVLFPQVRDGIIAFGEQNILHRPLGNHAHWHKDILALAFSGFFIFISFFLFAFPPVPILKKKEPAILKYAPPVITVALSVIILFSIYVRIDMYSTTRSLWVDEAAFAESIITRDFRTLTASTLVNNQTAPVLYLYVVKVIGSIFGYTEGALRSFSFIMLLGLLVVEGVLLKKAYNVNKVFIFLALCLTSTLDIYMRYSNELKPYMGDAFFVLLVLLLYHLYSDEKIKLPIVTFIYCIVLLFSSPALFFVAAVFIVEFITALIKKDRKLVTKTVIAGIMVLAFFITYYIWWLMPVAENNYMITYWENNRFRLFTLKPEYIKTNISLVIRLFVLEGFLYLPFAAVGFIISIRRKNKITYAVGAAVLLLLTASNLGKYPMVDRLWLFAYAIIILYMIVCLDSMKSVALQFNTEKTGMTNRPAACLAVFLGFSFVIGNGNVVSYLDERLYLNRQEANPLIEYVRSHIKDDEYLYSYNEANFVLKFKNGYDTERIGNVSENNIIYGKPVWTDETILNDDLNKVVNAKKSYLLFSHAPPERTAAFINKLKTLGRLEEVMNFHGTLLYYFTAAELEKKN